MLISSLLALSRKYRLLNKFVVVIYPFLYHSIIILPSLSALRQFIGQQEGGLICEKYTATIFPKFPFWHQPNSRKWAG